MLFTSPARILYGSPLSRPKVAKFAVTVLAVLVAICISVIVQRILMPLKPDALQVFLIAMVWGGLLSMIPIAILWFLDRREHESKWLYGLTFLWGALIATAIAQPINSVLHPAIVT